MKNHSLQHSILHSINENHAVLDKHGLYNSIQFVLRLSPEVHRNLNKSSEQIVSADSANFLQVQAFSTLLHETIHWWQHIGTTFGLMRSMSYPAQTHANYQHLKKLLNASGFSKSVRDLSAVLSADISDRITQETANRIVNNHFDFLAYRSLLHSPEATRSIVFDPRFESVGHSIQIAHANNILILSTVADPGFQSIEHPKHWENPFETLRLKKEPGFYYGSPITLWPIGAHEILEGQALFSQIQYLYFSSQRKLSWSDFRNLGMLHGVYIKAFSVFLEVSNLSWPDTIDHPTVALFLLICDIALNSGAGFPFPIIHFDSFINDTDPASRFMFLSTIIRTEHPSAASAITNYSRAEYEEISTLLSNSLLIEPPLAISGAFTEWTQKNPHMIKLMDEYNDFQFSAINMPIRVLFTHFLSFMRDKHVTPEVFCWPGAWMAGTRVSSNVSTLFDRHGALFIDKEDDDGVFPRIRPGLADENVQEMFESFYAVHVVYDLVDQWISRAGPFTYDHRWLSQSGSPTDMKQFADRHFEQAFGVHPDSVALL